MITTARNDFQLFLSFTKAINGITVRIENIRILLESRCHSTLSVRDRWNLASVGIVIAEMKQIWIMKKWELELGVSNKRQFVSCKFNKLQNTAYHMHKALYNFQHFRLRMNSLFYEILGLNEQF